MPKIKLNFKSL